MSKEQGALNALAAMRDQKAVFHSVRQILSKPLADDEKLSFIRQLYDTFDESRPE